MEILEVKVTLDGRRKEFPCELCLRAPGRVVILYRLKRDIVLDGVPMPAGTLSFGHYWEDRGYNVYHWIWPDGTTAAYYINLADGTSIGEEVVVWRDLTVDVMVMPDGTCRQLDEDELPADLDPTLRATIDSTVAHLVSHWDEVAREVEVESRRCMATHDHQVSTTTGA